MWHLAGGESPLASRWGGEKRNCKNIKHTSGGTRSTLPPAPTALGMGIETLDNGWLAMIRCCKTDQRKELTAGISGTSAICRLRLRAWDVEAGHCSFNGDRNGYVDIFVGD